MAIEVWDPAAGPAAYRAVTTTSVWDPDAGPAAYRTVIAGWIWNPVTLAWEPWLASTRQFNLADAMTAAAITNLTRQDFIVKEAVATIGDTLVRSTTSRTTAPQSIADTMTAAATKNLIKNTLITKSASAAISEAIRQTDALAIPAAPSGLGAVESVSTPPDVDLTWSDNASNETSYSVQRALDVGGSPGTWNTIENKTLPVDDEAHTDATTATGTKYWYRVFCSNARGDSGFSNQVSITTSSEE